MITKIETEEVRVERIGGGTEFEGILEHLSRSRPGIAAPTAVQTARIEGVRLLYINILKNISVGQYPPKIQAIKALREIAAMDLKAAKDLVESW